VARKKTKAPAEAPVHLVPPDGEKPSALALCGYAWKQIITPTCKKCIAEAKRRERKAGVA
jgi:hypothetical protein